MRLAPLALRFFWDGDIALVGHLARLSLIDRSRGQASFGGDKGLDGSLRRLLLFWAEGGLSVGALLARHAGGRRASLARADRKAGRRCLAPVGCRRRFIGPGRCNILQNDPNEEERIIVNCSIG